MAGPSRTLRLGDQAPPFTLLDVTSGRTLTLDGLLDGRRGLLLVFHRGMW